MLSIFDPSHRSAPENEQSSIYGDYPRTRGRSELDVVIMKARDLMTREVISTSPETPVRDIAALLSAHRISAVPVVDQTGTVVGMVSEGDLIGRRQTECEKQREWWLVMLAEGETLSDNFLASLRTPDRTARDIMSYPVIQVSEETEASEIATLLARHRIKRVPVVRDQQNRRHHEPGRFAARPRDYWEWRTALNMPFP